jgi:RimJ/RimL family protein N-acetyltransferase
MTRENSCKLVSVNQHKDLALCFTQRTNLADVIHAVGRYYYIESNNCGEVAFVISEHKRGKGMAKTLLDEIIKIATIREVDKLVACVRRDNAPMLKVFKKAGFIRKYSEEMDEINLALQLDPLATANKIEGKS